MRIHKKNRLYTFLRFRAYAWMLKMYFIKIDDLKNRLKEGPLPDGEALPYLIANSLFVTLVFAIPSEYYFNIWDGLEVLGGVIALFWGVHYGYEMNGGTRGSNFIQKYIVVGWVVTFRWFLISIPIFIVFYVILGLSGFYAGETNVFEFALYLALEIIVFQRIGYHIYDTRNRDHETEELIYCEDE